MKVQLLTFPGCPNAGAARDLVANALAAEHLSKEFEEVNVEAADAPAELKAWGSPTILVDGRDVAGAQPTGSCCRLYRDEGPARGLPSEATVRRALREAAPARSSWLHALGAVPGALVAILPALTCPACLPAYLGLFSAFGVVLTNRVLVPLTVGLLVLGVASVGWTMRSHGRAGPLLVTIAGSIAIVLGRIVWSAPAVLYGGAALLVGASLWNLWLKRRRPPPLVSLRLGRSRESAS